MYAETLFWIFSWGQTLWFSRRCLYDIEWQKLIRQTLYKEKAFGELLWRQWRHWNCRDCNKDFIYRNNFCTYYLLLLCFHQYHYCHSSFYSNVFVIPISVILMSVNINISSATSTNFIITLLLFWHHCFNNFNNSYISPLFSIFKLLLL